MDHVHHQSHTGIHLQKIAPVKSIAFFDFDGTITTKDTLLEIFRFHAGSSKFYWGFFLNSPVLIAYKLGIISNHKAKERMLRYFFGKMPLNAFNERCRTFADTLIPSFIRPKALKEIQRLKEAGVEVVIVSASAENWLVPWCNAQQVKLIATQLQVRDQRITGRIEGINCFGAQKVTRIQAEYHLPDYQSIYCYGDTPGDQAMLDLGDKQFYQPFR